MEQAQAVADFSEPTSMKELYNAIYLAGELWREEHKEERIISKGPRAGETETKIPMPSTKDVADNLMKLCYFRFIGTGEETDKFQLYIYNLDTGLYMASQDLFNRLCFKFDTRLKSGNYREIHILLRTMTKTVRPFENPNLVPVSNGIFNLKTKQLLDFSPQYAITSKINTRYNSEATKPILAGWFDFDQWVNTIACGDGEVVTLLWQIMNEAINPNYTRGKLAILLGDGNNGKGTFQSLLINLIGVDKVSTLRPDQFEGHNLASLAGKVCNIGDDISNKYVDEVSDLMSIVTGETITINPKHQQPFELSLKLFCLFSANELPRVRNKSQGWYRRLCIVPFNADFNGQKERPEIKNEFLKDKGLLEWVLFKILNMPKFDKFIEPKVVQEELKKYKKENDYLVAFVADDYTERGLHLIARVPLKWIKEEYVTFLADNNLSANIPYGFGKHFIKSLQNHTGSRYSLKIGRFKKEEAEAFPYPLTLVDYTEGSQSIVEKDPKR